MWKLLDIANSRAAGAVSVAVVSAAGIALAAMGASFLVVWLVLAFFCVATFVVALLNARQGGLIDPPRQTRGRVPKWVQWQIDNPRPPYDNTPRGRGANRGFWLAVMWEVRIWLAFAVLIVIASIVLLVLVLIDAAG